MNFPRIPIDASQMDGVPCIRGLRIPVATVVAMLADGMATDEILACYPVRGRRAFEKHSATLKLSDSNLSPSAMSVDRRGRAFTRRSKAESAASEPPVVLSSARLAPAVPPGAPAMESAMGIKDAVKALLERLPDDCSLDDIIDRLYELDRAAPDDHASLTEAQRAELDRRLDLLEREPGRLIPWAEFRRELDREE